MIQNSNENELPLNKARFTFVDSRHFLALNLKKKRFLKMVDENVFMDVKKHQIKVKATYLQYEQI